MKVAFLCFVLINLFESGAGGTKYVRSFKSTGVPIGSTLPKESTIGSKFYKYSQKDEVKTRFSRWKNVDWSFNDWNSWRMSDGMLCRSNADCIWMDKMLECDRYRFGWNVRSGWFNGNGSTHDILGVCDCIRTLIWRDEQIECQAPGTSDILTGFHIFMIIFTILLFLCVCHCCMSRA